MRLQLERRAGLGLPEIDMIQNPFLNPSKAFEVKVDIPESKIYLSKNIGIQLFDKFVFDFKIKYYGWRIGEISTQYVVVETETSEECNKLIKFLCT